MMSDYDFLGLSAVSLPPLAGTSPLSQASFNQSGDFDMLVREMELFTVNTLSQMVGTVTGGEEGGGLFGQSASESFASALGGGSDWLMPNAGSYSFQSIPGIPDYLFDRVLGDQGGDPSGETAGSEFQQDMTDQERMLKFLEMQARVTGAGFDLLGG